MSLRNTKTQLEAKLMKLKKFFNKIWINLKIWFAENEDKKLFHGGLINIFTILLNTKCRKQSPEKTIKLWQKQKATVRRLLTFVPAPGQRICNKDILKKRLIKAPFKIKNPLPNGQVVRRMIVRQKSYYFSGNRILQFHLRKKRSCV